MSRPLTFGSLCSGVEAASLAWQPLGWRCAWVAETDKHCRSVLQHHHPDVPNLGDVSRITQADIAAHGSVDVVIAGFPCQDVSIAGQRKGFTNADGRATRSGLFWGCLRVADWTGARWFVLENVPGLFTSNDRRDFAAVVGALAGAAIDLPEGSTWANTGVAAGPRGLVEWSVLDAQWFGLAQRRDRVFLVRDSGDWRNRPPVLFDAESVRGNPPPRREAGADVAGTIAGGAHPSGFNGRDAEVGNVVVARPLTAHAHGSRLDLDTENFVVNESFNIIGGGQASPNHAYAAETSGCLQSKGLAATGNEAGTVILATSAFHATQDPISGDVVPSLGGNSTCGVHQSGRVRRLTERECERLMGFPDDYTNVPHKGKPMPGGARYRMLGNSFAVPVVRWIGERIAEVDGMARP